VSASGRSRRASAEKMPVGFGAAKIHKKSSRLNQRRTNTNELNPRQKSRANSPGLSEAGYRSSQQPR